MPIALVDLKPEFLIHEWIDGRQINRHTDSLAEATGVFLLCPACFTRNGGPVGTHGLIVTFADRGVPDHLGSHGSKGQPTRWQVRGSGLHDLTTTPSIDVGCWHGYLTDGVCT